jgi:hypothetical protein
MKTSFTYEENKYNLIFENYINGNLSDFRKEVRKQIKLNLLKCIDLQINNYGHSYQDRDILRIFLYHMQSEEIMIF